MYYMLVKLSIVRLKFWTCFPVPVSVQLENTVSFPSTHEDVGWAAYPIWQLTLALILAGI